MGKLGGKQVETISLKKAIITYKNPIKEVLKVTNKVNLSAS